MNDLFWGIRISVLWIANAFALTVAFIFAFFEPGFLDDLMSGKLYGDKYNAGFLLFVATFWIIPLLMMYLSLVLGRPVLRWLNIVFGLLFALVYLLYLIGQVSSFKVTWLASGILSVLLVLISLMIAWHGWNWPQEIE